MRFRMGLVLGFGLGYVLGSKAGRDRYEQLLGTARGLMENERVKGVVDQVGGVAAEVVEAVTDAVTEAASESVAGVEDVETADHGTSNGKI